MHDYHDRRLRGAKSCLEEGAKGSLHAKGEVVLNQRAGGHRNYKKEALMEARFTEIERANRILLERMTSIMKNGNPHSTITRPQTVPTAQSMCKHKCL